MTKIEFMAMCLPYGLKMEYPNGFIPNRKERTGISGIGLLTGDLYADIENETFGEEAVFKPILRPLSELTREIVQDRKKFVPFEVLEESMAPEEDIQLKRTIERGIDCKYLPFWAFKKLIEWHFDIAELIEKGEAIPVTDDFNPYAR